MTAEEKLAHIAKMASKQIAYLEYASKGAERDQEWTYYERYNGRRDTWEEVLKLIANTGD